MCETRIDVTVSIDFAIFSVCADNLYGHEKLRELPDIERLGEVFMLSSLGVLPIIVSKYLVVTTHSTFRIGLLIKTVEDKMANGKWQMANGNM